MGHSRITVKYKDIEISIKGSEEFIGQQQDKLSDYCKSIIQAFTEGTPKARQTSLDTDFQTEQKLNLEEMLNQGFSFWKKAINPGSNEEFSYALAGYYLQLRNKDGYFTSKDVFTLLYNHGILLTDIYKSEIRNLSAKNIIKVGTLKGKPKFKINPDTVTIKLLHEILESSCG